ncbi:MAG: hypothetical protein RMI94_07200 [Bryobacterales bacterium]|nr:hypothetical protein [Bryobacteraceae bacterium]MDW8130319.1 hypothetical protein [Bryobacterales bacterium]
MRVRYLIAILLVCASLLLAKTYTITLSEPSRVAGAELKPGNYSLKVEGDKAIFLDRTRKPVVEATVRIENAARKFEATAIEFRKESGQNRIQAISLGGSKMKLLFD